MVTHFMELLSILSSSCRVLDFNKCDLYTKSNDASKINVDELWPYYDKLIEKYGLDGSLKW